MAVTVNDIGGYINALSAETSPDTSNDLLLLRDATDGSMKKISPANLVGELGGGLDPSGWQAADAMAYASADDPTFTATITGDQSAKYSVGMRIKLTQTTVKYFIITAVTVSTDTTLTLYGGTDYDLADAAITNPYYSPCKSPVGFPLNPAKWTVTGTGTTGIQESPTQNVWYNLGSKAISLPIGAWMVRYIANLLPTRGSAGWSTQAITLSTANNSESDATTTLWVGGNAINAVFAPATMVKNIIVASKTAYYLNCKTDQSTFSAISTNTTSIIEAVCAYL